MLRKIEGNQKVETKGLVKQYVNQAERHLKKKEYDKAVIKTSKRP